MHGSSKYPALSEAKCGIWISVRSIPDFAALNPGYTLRVLSSAYVFQYRYDGRRLVMLRVFHGREARE
jgi:hypothetical protein